MNFAILHPLRFLFRSLGVCFRFQP